MRPECIQIANVCTAEIKLVEEAPNTFVEAEFVNNYTASLWVSQEPAPAHRVDLETGDVQISYGYFDDMYGPYRGQYMLPQMKEVAPAARLRWRIEDPELLNKMLVPGTAVQLRLRIALEEFPESPVRGSQPVDEYVEASCPVEFAAKVLRE